METCPRVNVIRLGGSEEDVSGCFYLKVRNPTLHLRKALAARRTLLRSKFIVMKYLGYAVGAVLVFSAFMRVGSRDYGSETANEEAMRSVAVAPNWLERDLVPSVRTRSYGIGYLTDGRPGQMELAIEADFPDGSELEPFPDLAEGPPPIALNMHAQAEQYTCASDLPPFPPPLFHPWAEDHLEDP